MRVITSLVLFLLIASPVWAAPFLAWDPVVNGSDGLPLGSGLAVTEYRVYQCGPGVGTCSKTTGLRVATILAPTVQFDLAGTPTPSTYVVTAVNKVGESADSAPFKVVPPDIPKNLRIP